MTNQVLQNICTLYNTVKVDMKSNILGLVAYEELKSNILKIGFKFNNKTFNNAVLKRNSGEFCLKSHIRAMPPSKKPLNAIEKNSIIRQLQDNSKDSGKNDDIKYLNSSKKEIYRQYIRTNIRKIAYNTFLRYIPKNFKPPSRRTDMCGICSIGQKIEKLGTRNLSGVELDCYNNDLLVYNNHKLIAKSQKDSLTTLQII